MTVLKLILIAIMTNPDTLQSKFKYKHRLSKTFVCIDFMRQFAEELPLKLQPGLLKVRLLHHGTQPRVCIIADLTNL